jgi:arylsulfatase A-like enzyme
MEVENSGCAMIATMRLGVALALLMSTSASVAGARHEPEVLALTSPAPRPPSIVLVLMDDFSTDLLQTMAHARWMQRHGASYRHAFVVDSLCCVSRASIFTGQYPHQHRVLTNTANLPNPVGPLGGWEAFLANGNLHRSVNVRLERAGYTTGFIGKYLNGYLPTYDGLPATPPRGWSEFTAVLRSAYDGWDFEYTVTEDGRVGLRRHPAPPAWAPSTVKDRAYADRLTGRRALDYIARHRGARRPYFLEVATYAPHDRVGVKGYYPGDPMFPPAFRDRPRPGRPAGYCGPVACTDLTLADLRGFRDDPADNAPVWRDGRPAPAWRMTGPHIRARDAVEALRNRARMVQTVDRMLGRILRAVDANTYVVLTSDNGFHLGPGSLGRGKATPYTSDARVPLLVVGPRVPVGARDDVVTNIDLAPTFEDLAGIASPAFRSGASLVPSLRDPAYAPHGYAFFEHTWSPSLGGGDPDRWYAGAAVDAVPSYVAVRSRTGLLVRFDLDRTWAGRRYAWEFYDYRDSRVERTNSFADPAKRADVRRHLRRLTRFLGCRTVRRDAPVPDRCRELTLG